jgi:hypothetical protein
MHSARAGPGVLLQAAASTPPDLEITIVAPGQVTETSLSPGLQVRSQLLLGAQLSWWTKCSPVEPGGPGGPAGPAGPVAPGGPGGPCGPASPCCPAGPCGPFEQAASENAASSATVAIDARISSPLCYDRWREVFIRAGRCQCAPDCVGSHTAARLADRFIADTPCLVPDRALTFDRRSFDSDIRMIACGTGMRMSEADHS